MGDDRLNAPGRILIVFFVSLPCAMAVMPVSISSVAVSCPGLLAPNSIAYHPSGFWVVSDTGNDRLLLLNMDLSINKTLVGVLNRPRGVAVDQLGRIWASDGGNDRIVVLSPQLSVLCALGSFGTGPAEFSLPWGISVDFLGRVAIADALNRRVQILGPDLNPTLTVGSWGTGEGEFDGPLDLCFDSSARLFVVDTYLEAEGYVRRVQVFNPDFSFNRTIWDIQSRLRFTRPVGIGISPGGLVAVADFGANRIYLFDSVGEHLGDFGLVAGQPALETPYDIAFCPLQDGSLLAGIVERDPNRVRVIRMTVREAHAGGVILVGVMLMSAGSRLGAKFSLQRHGWVRTRSCGGRPVSGKDRCEAGTQAVVSATLSGVFLNCVSRRGNTPK